MGERVYEYEVCGTESKFFGFPEDMLRYDQAEIVQKLSDKKLGSTGDRRFCKYRIRGKRRPTKARWESFGWEAYLVREVEGKV